MNEIGKKLRLWLRKLCFLQNGRLWPWPLTFWPKNNRGLPQLIVVIWLKYERKRVRGTWDIVRKPFVYRQTDRQTDGQTDRQQGWNQYTPLTSLRGYNKNWIVEGLYSASIQAYCPLNALPLTIVNPQFHPGEVLPTSTHFRLGWARQSGVRCLSGQGQASLPMRPSRHPNRLNRAKVRVSILCIKIMLLT